jgi:putative oxygen-independent coproporphyrinogen III oxidase
VAAIGEAATPDRPVLDWTPRASTLGVYVHVPFCIKRCGYCSFNTAPYLERAVPRFVRAVLAEIDTVAAAGWAPAVRASTVFFGGGTPSLLAPEQLAAILDRLRARLSLPAGVEVTVECNPDGLTRERLVGFRAAGVSRISLGVQSLDDALLPRIDRLHTAAQAREAFAAARAAGFDNVSVDLMYGLPGLDVAAWERTLDEALAWRPDHLSAYGLTLDEGSVWRPETTAGLPSDDEATAQYRALTRRTRAAGLEHYEVSNYAQPGRRSQHNQIYWHAEEYLALGPGACGFLGGVRYGNVKAVERYCATLEAGGLPVATHERLAPRQILAERLMLGLRLAEGVPESWLDERITLDPRRLRSVIASWTDLGLLRREDGRVHLTEDGFLLSDTLFSELI